MNPVTTLCQTRPVAGFQYLVGHNTFLGGQDFYFYYMSKTNFSGRGGTKEILGELPPNAPSCLRACARTASHWQKALMRFPRIP